jgi:hypothetical protein
MSEDSENNKSQTMGGDALVGLMEKPEAMLNNALSTLAKKTAASFWGNFKRLLSTASEPLLRKEMGERYLSAEAGAGGVIIWTLSTLLALYVPELRSVAPTILESFHWYALARLFTHWESTLAVGGLLVFLSFKFSKESLSLMTKYRADGLAHHTQSRGVPRWDNFPMMPLWIIVALFLFDLPAGILFVASMGMSSKIAAEQQAAIYARYLDALDAKIEQEYLENAILGKCPAEITQLHKPLSAALNEDLRKNIAAAAVGKSVKIVTKEPRKGAPAP